jgi:lipopolysaccharide biosynthesis protein
MKIIAWYLPQFHEIPENNEWWGENFTEWVVVKKAKPLFDGHYQPHIPLNRNYYNLLDDDVKKWQVEIAKKHGIYGFAFYHYWFDGKLLLEKPVEQYLENKELNLPFCICWANEHWTNRWAKGNQKVLIEQRYGEVAEWDAHFKYLLPFLKSERYICNNGRPLFIFFRPEIIPCLNDMIDRWQHLAKESGLPGIDFANSSREFCMSQKDETRFAFHIEHRDTFTAINFEDKKTMPLKRRIQRYVHNKYKINLINPFKRRRVGIVKFNEKWEWFLRRSLESEKSIPGAYVGWDNTPRYGNRGSVHINSSPEMFKEYLKKQIIHARDDYKKDMIFMFAWNEWAEGGHLEPDEKYGYQYLEAVRDALIETDEFPK